MVMFSRRVLSSTKTLKALRFNGDYVQQVGEVHNQRPVYYCASNQMLLFYCKKWTQWAIHKRKGTGANCRIRTERSAHRPGEGLSWSLWKNQGGKKGFVEEPKMTCTLISSEELMTSLPPEFIVAVDFAQAPGIFKKQEGTKDDLAVYYNSKAKSMFDYEQAKRRWQWWICNDSGEKERVMISSAETAAFSPDRASWTFQGKAIRLANVEYTPVVQQEGWKDPDFPHDQSSIGEKNDKDGGCKRLKRGDLFDMR